MTPKNILLILALASSCQSVPNRDAFMSREHKVTQVLKECLSSLTCHVAMIAHVSPASQHYTDTLGTVQFASRVHRIRRRRFKVSILFSTMSFIAKGFD